MASLGEAVLTLRTDDSAFNKGIDGAESKARGLGEGMSGAAKAGVAALAGLGVAAGAAAKVSLAEFQSFERGMNEVFTLVPGASKQMMSSMSADVKSFSTEFGVLPNEVIPALYQALSAGVPQNNVFDFMEVAQKAAIGGVTSLETAVDGISSVINAYGSDVISAGEASDLMFTAVRLGKTTFDELSASLFNVTPVASSLGVNFSEITAAMATMTAQGVPTSVVTTQLRQLFVELSKEGSKTDQVFREIAGMGFRDFIASGGTVQEALLLLEQYAGSTGVGINDLFGSVEAGSAALALTGGNTEAFSASLQAMGESAGATDAAFQQMDQGVGRSIDRLKSQFAVLRVELGEALAPAIARIADAFTGVVGFITGTVIPAFQSLPAPIQTIVAVVGILGTAFAAVAVVVGPLVLSFGGLVAAAGGVGAILGGVAAALAAVAGPALIVVGVAAALAAGAILIYKNWDAISDLFQRVASSIGDAFPGISQAFDGVRDAAANFADYVRESFDQVMSHTTNLVRAIRNSGGEIGLIFTGLGNTILGSMQVAVAGVMLLVDGILASAKGIAKALSGDFRGAWDELSGGYGDMWTNFDASLEAGTARQVRGVEQMAEGFTGVFNNIATDWRNLMEQLGVDYNALESMVDDFAATNARAMLDASGSTGDLIVNVVELAREYGQTEEQIGHMVDAIGRQETAQGKATTAYVYALGILQNYSNALDVAAEGMFELDRADRIAAQSAGDVASAVSDATEELDEFAASLGTLGGIQDVFQANIGYSASRVSEWEGHLKGAETALGWLQSRIDQGIPLTAEQASQYEVLTGAVQRYTGGIDDEMQGLVAAEVAKANYIAAQDELNAAIERGESNLEPYKQAMRDAVGEMDPAALAAMGLTDAQGKLVDAIEGVVGQIRDLMIELGLLDDTEADAEVYVDGIPEAVGGVAGAGDELATFDGSSATATVNVAIDKALENAREIASAVEIPNPPTILLTADGGDVLSEADIVTGAVQIPDPATITFTADGSDVLSEADIATVAINNVPKNPAATILEAVDNISSVAYNALGAINALPSSFTVTINADAAGFYATVAGVDSYIPRSPAKRGPFSRVPDWNYMWEGLPAAGRYWWGRTLEEASVAQGQFSTAGRRQASAYAQGITAGEGEVVSAGRRLTERTNEAVVEELGGGRQFHAEMFLSELGQFSEFLLTMVTESALTFETDLLDRARGYTDAVSAAVDMIGGAFELMRLLGNSNPNADSARAAVTELKFLTEHIVVSVGDSAAWVGANRPEGFLPMAEEYMTSAEQGVSLMTAGVEAFSALSEVSGNLDRAKDAASQIKFLTEHIVLSIGDSAAYVNSTRGEGFTTAAETYMTAADKGIDLMLKGGTVMAELSSLEGDLDTAKANASQIKFLTEHIVLSIGDSAAYIASERGDGFVAHAETYATAAIAAMTLMSQGVETFAALQVFEGDLEVANANASQVKFLSEHIVRSLGDSAALFTADGLAHMTLFVDAALRGQELMLSAGDTLAAMLDFGNIDAGGVDLASRAEAMVALVELVTTSMQTAALTFETSGLQAVESFSSAAQAAMDTIGQAGAALEAILLFATVDTTDRDLAEMSNAMVELIELVTRNIEAVAVHWQSEGLAAVEAFSTSAAQGLEVMSVAGEALSSILMYGEMTPEERDNLRTLAWEFTGVMDYLISMIQDVSRNYNRDALSALSEFAADATTSLNLVKAAADAFKAMVDHSRVTNEHAQSFIESWEIMVWAIQEIAQLVSNQGVQEAVRILNANQEIFALLNEAYGLWQQNQQMSADMGGGTVSTGSGSQPPSTGAATGGAPITDSALPSTGATTSTSGTGQPAGTSVRIVDHPEGYYKIYEDSSGRMVSWEYIKKMATGGVTTDERDIRIHPNEGIIPLEGRGSHLVARAIVREIAHSPALRHALMGGNLSGFSIPRSATEGGNLSVNFLGNTTIVARDQEEARRAGEDIGWSVQQKLRAGGRA